MDVWNDEHLSMTNIYRRKRISVSHVHATRPTYPSKTTNQRADAPPIASNIVHCNHCLEMSIFDLLSKTAW